MLLWVLRAFYLLILAGAAAMITTNFSGAIQYEHAGLATALVFLGIMGAGMLVVVLDILSPNKRVGNISAIYFGLLVGNLLGYAVYLAFSPIVETWANAEVVAPFSLVMTIILCYVCVSVLLQTQNDFRLIIPYVEFSRQRKGGRPLILDTSVIIDGRIADIADTGLLDQAAVVPRFVLDEVQAMANSNDKLRKKRGQRGLDVLDRLRQSPKVDLEIIDEDVQSRLKGGELEARLVRLAKSLDGRLVTNDVNLAKLAKLQQVETINIHEVATAAKPPVLWGERLTVRLVKEGEEPGQGIGYLEDGTMVVAEMGKSFVGTDVSLVVTSVLQTSAGRMVFGRVEGKAEPARAK